MLVAELLYYMKKLRDKVNNDAFVKHWVGIPLPPPVLGPYENYWYCNSVETFLKDHCSFWFLMLCLQHFLAGEII